jgi:hypothetical protein
VQGHQIVEVADLLQHLPSPIVFDHMARIPQPAGVNHHAFGLVLKLLDSGRTWVKLSGAYMETRTGLPTYARLGSEPSSGALFRLGEVQDSEPVSIAEADQRRLKSSAFFAANSSSVRMFSGAAQRGVQSPLRCPPSRAIQQASERRQPLQAAQIRAFVRASRKRGKREFETDRRAETPKASRGRARGRIDS